MYRHRLSFIRSKGRTVQSAKIIAETCEVPSKPLDGFQERNWGIYANRPWSDVKQVLDELSLEERFLYVPENRESWKAFEERLINAVKNTLEANKDKNIVIVTHGGSIRALMPFLLGVPKKESFRYDPQYASLTIFEYDGNSFKPITIDDVSHLK